VELDFMNLVQFYTLSTFYCQTLGCSRYHACFIHRRFVSSG